MTKTATQERLEGYFTTDRQRGFETNFRLGAEKLEVWDEIEIGQSWPAQNTFEVTEADIVAFNKGNQETDPLFTDPEFARANSPTGSLLIHPLFSVLVTFYCIGTGPGNWIRTPGARNPGQDMEFHEPFKAGEVITDKVTAFDKWQRRDKFYVTYQHDMTNQDGVLKATWCVTLIVPPSRDEIVRFATA